jgi:hypothetical protein
MDCCGEHRSGCRLGVGGARRAKRRSRSVTRDGVPLLYRALLKVMAGLPFAARQPGSRSPPAAAGGYPTPALSAHHACARVLPTATRRPQRPLAQDNYAAIRWTTSAPGCGSVRIDPHMPTHMLRASKMRSTVGPVVPRRSRTDPAAQPPGLRRGQGRAERPGAPVSRRLRANGRRPQGPALATARPFPAWRAG